MAERARGMHRRAMDHIRPTMSGVVRASWGTSHRLELGVRRGDLVRIRHGAYVGTLEWASSGNRERMLSAIEATRAAARSAEPIFAFELAAALHGIPIIGSWPSRAHTVTAHGGARSNGSVIRTRRDEPAGAIVTVGDRVRATSLVVTAVDLASTRTVLGGIVAFDHIRFHHEVELDEILQEIERRRPFRGVRQADVAARRSTAGSATPAETLAVVRIHDLGFEAPQQQFSVRGVDGVEYDVDLSWGGGRILGEIDGRSKYEIAAAERGTTVSDRIWAEKRREDAIRSTCDRFVRGVWDDLWWGDRFDRALDAAGVRRVARRRPLTF